MWLSYQFTIYRVILWGSKKKLSHRGDCKATFEGSLFNFQGLKKWCSFIWILWTELGCAFQRKDKDKESLNWFWVSRSRGLEDTKWHSVCLGLEGWKKIPSLWWSRHATGSKGGSWQSLNKYLIKMFDLKKEKTFYKNNWLLAVFGTCLMYNRTSKPSWQPLKLFDVLPQE